MTGVEVRCRECDGDITDLVEFDPGCAPVPGIHNHDDPRFSDPGTPGTCDGPDKCPHCKIEITQRDLELLFEDWCERQRDHEEGLRADAQIAAWESRHEEER